MNSDKYIINKKYVNSSILTRLLEIAKKETEDTDCQDTPFECQNADLDTAELDEFIKNNL